MLSRRDQSTRSPTTCFRRWGYKERRPCTTPASRHDFLKRRRTPACTDSLSEACRGKPALTWKPWAADQYSCVSPASGVAVEVL